MDKKEITELRKKFWSDNFKKYTTEPDENGFDFKYGEMMDDFAEHLVNNLPIQDVQGSFLDQFEKSEMKDLKKVSEMYDDILHFIHSTNLPEVVIESLLEPFTNLLEHNGVNLKETDY